MRFTIIIVFFMLFFNQNTNSENTSLNSNDYFYIGKMDSYNKNFTLYFKTREKSILSRGEENNYITDYPQDLYIYNHELKTDEPLITYEWFPSYVKKLSKNYRYPVFPEDFAYYLMEDNNTLILVSANKNFFENLKFDIALKKISKIKEKGKISFIISSYAKNCGFKDTLSKFNCKIYKPLISTNLIN